jgi:hypothetical protein
MLRSSIPSTGAAVPKRVGPLEETPDTAPCRKSRERRAPGLWDTWAVAVLGAVCGAVVVAAGIEELDEP